jgi:hypothetical protein
MPRTLTSPETLLDPEDIKLIKLLSLGSLKKGSMSAANVSASVRRRYSHGARRVGPWPLMHIH